MFAEYIRAALSKATYEIIEDQEPFYGEIPELRGVWAIGKTLEECRENLKGVIEGWIALRLRLGLAIPPINGMRQRSPGLKQLSRLTSISWSELVKRLGELGFEGPYLSSGPHPYFMRRGDLTVDLPNPHKQDIGVGLLKKILKQAEISRDEWLSSI